jgi:hypothetical protein
MRFVSILQIFEMDRGESIFKKYFWRSIASGEIQGVEKLRRICESKE